MTEKKAQKIVLDLGRRYVMARYASTADDKNPLRPTSEEILALETISEMLGKDLDPQTDGTMQDLVGAMEKRNE